MQIHAVSAQEWEAARQKLLVKEKELTHARDALAAERRRMPWLAVEKKYEFEGPKGKASLRDQSTSATSESQRSAAGVIATTERSSASRSNPGSSGAFDAVVLPSSRALRNPSAMCGVSRPMKAVSAGVNCGLDRSRCKHRKPQQAPLVISAARSSSPKASGARISR